MMVRRYIVHPPWNTLTSFLGFRTGSPGIVLLKAEQRSFLKIRDRHFLGIPVRTRQVREKYCYEAEPTD